MACRMQAGAVDLLWAVVHDASVPLLARSRAAQVFHVLACSADGLKVTTIQRVAEMLVRCVLCTRSVARVGVAFM
jgi:hypothetical protein